ncbi:MAG: META domain-containing protein [Proteobacteria bacterium]|nr:META domain-containing protein [Pseudomonadota bacterium]
MLRLLFPVGIGLLLASCASGGPVRVGERRTELRSVVGKTWQWEALITPVEKITVPNPENYTIRLTEAGKVEARFDCNRGGGTYQIAPGKLTFGPLISTRMACPPGTLDAPFMRDLGRVNSFFVEGGKLYLELPLESGTMRFREAP